MPKEKITNLFIRNITTQKINSARVNYFDTEFSGFMCEVRKSGSITYYYRYTKDYKTTMHKLGTPDSLTADEARRLAMKVKKALATDSLEDLFKKKSSCMTLQEFYDTHYLPYVKLHSKSWKHNESHFKIQILPKLGDKLMNEITPPEISSMQLELVQKRKLQYNGVRPLSNNGVRPLS